MRVLMNQNLLDLYQTGKSRKYKEVEKNRDLLEGFIRAVNIMTIVQDVSELSGYRAICTMSSLNTNGQDIPPFACQTDTYIGLSLRKPKMGWKLNLLK